MQSLLRWTASLLAGSALAASDYPGDALNLEAHGFASFGYLSTSGDNWLGQTIGGTDEFWEAAANVVSRPLDRLRLGAQLYARDLVKYDNGRATLDWAYADYRFADAFGLSAGRVKLPIGLYNEELDVDAARTPVFLPVSIYALRSRDLYISVDGAKAYGLIGAGPLGSLEYAAYGGRKAYDRDSGFATYLSELGLGDQIEHVETAWLGGGMLHWNTPYPGLAFRLSLSDAHGFDVAGSYPSLGVSSHTHVDDYYQGVVSALLELDSVTIATEYLRIRGRGVTTFEPALAPVAVIDDTTGWYLSATWHARRWLEFYAALETTWADPHHRSTNHAYTGVAAVHVLPLPHWSLKAEFRDVHGTAGLNAADNPDGLDEHWQVFAFKTTVDF